MTDPTAPAGNAAPAPAEAQTDEQAIRERVRELTAQMLAGGRLDTESVKEVVRTMSGGVSKPPLESAQAREAFAEAIRGLDEALHWPNPATCKACRLWLRSARTMCAWRLPRSSSRRASRVDLN